MRRKVPRKKDVKVFRNTAAGSKKINLGVKLYRGGIRF